MIRNKGFTLMELLIVITLLGILSGLIFSMLRNASPAARDIKRKQDVEAVKKSLEIYYSDVEAYPTVTSAMGMLWGGNISHPTAAKTYMQVLPRDPVSAMNYFYFVSADKQSYKLYTCLENTSDSAYSASIGTVEGANCGVGCSGICNYGISSENTTP
ncbi:MAG: type II secretion system GspH family protein [Candidatus Roizmanbacteria bacterium]|nr:type II secretion system GspH family protein [Candidatus Roizmanbacteria bacterium]